MIYAIIGGAVLLVIVLFVIITKNSIAATKNKLEYAFAGMDVQLKKRRDLIPNLVEAVKQYMGHESKLLTDIVQLRNQVSAPNQTEAQRFQTEGQIGSMLGQIRVVAEGYPDLKANQNFLQLQGALNDTEEQIAASRRAYNAAVMDYNNCLDMFPYSMFAGGMPRKAPFEISEAERQNVDLRSLF